MPVIAGDQMSTFRHKLSENNLIPLWEVARNLLSPEPKSRAVPSLWKADEIRRLGMEAGGLISAEQAERRVLLLENPGLKGQSRVTPSLLAGMQMIMPGETAASHRHTTSVLRFILEGETAYTSVDGEKVSLKPGDFLITPAWRAHDHGNDGHEPVLWLDGVDLAIINLLDAGFFEGLEDDLQPAARPAGDAQARYGSGMVPIGYVPKDRSSPLFHYPYERTRNALYRIKESNQLDPHDGIRLRYTDPTTGRSPLPTMGAFLQLLPNGFKGRRSRSTDGTVFTLLEGRGTIDYGGGPTEVRPHDIFVIPSWTWYSWMADEDTVVASFSDRPLQEQLGVWREEREPGPNH